MKLLVLFVAVLGAVKADTSAWTQIRMKFSFSGALQNIEYFWPIANNLTAALAGGWTNITNVVDYNLITVCPSQTDVRACALYDGKGYIAGMQLAIPATDVDGHGYPYIFSNISAFQMKNINGVNYWTSVILVVNPTTLNAGGRTSFTNLGDSLWFTNGTSYTEVPTAESALPTTTLYTKQNCIPSMGTHYYYNVYPTSKCEEFQPFFVMTKNGNINGLGWQFFGQTTPPGRNWYDSIGLTAVLLTVPTGPPCLSDWVQWYGVISMHMYFEDNPWTNGCDQQTDSAVPITGFMKLGLDLIDTYDNVIDNIRYFLHLY